MCGVSVRRAQSVDDEKFFSVSYLPVLAMEELCFPRYGYKSLQNIFALRSSWPSSCLGCVVFLMNHCLQFLQAWSWNCWGKPVIAKTRKLCRVWGKLMIQAEQTMGKHLWGSPPLPTTSVFAPPTVQRVFRKQILDRNRIFCFSDSCSIFTASLAWAGPNDREEQEPLRSSQRRSIVRSTLGS